MFIVLAIMLAGIALGYLLRKRKPKGIGNAITFFIWVLLFLLGVEVGGNERIIRSLPTLGIEAVGISIAAVTGSCIAAWLLWRLVGSRGDKQ